MRDGGEYSGRLVFGVLGWWAIHQFIINGIKPSDVQIFVESHKVGVRFTTTQRNDVLFQNLVK